MDLLSNIKKGTKEYLMKAVVPSLVEGLTQMAIDRPEDPHLWLSEFILAKSPAASQYEIVDKRNSRSTETARSEGEASGVGGSGDSGGSGDDGVTREGKDTEPSESEYAGADAARAGSGYLEERHYDSPSKLAGRHSGFLVGTQFRVNAVYPRGTLGSASVEATIDITDLETDENHTMEVGAVPTEEEQREAAPPLGGGADFSGGHIHITSSAPTLFVGLEDIGRRLIRHRGELKLASVAEGLVKEAAETGYLQGSARGMKISGRHVVVSVSPSAEGDGSCIVGAHDVRGGIQMSLYVPPDRAGSLPPAFLRNPNPASPPLPDAWEALAARLSIADEPEGPVLVLS